MKRFSAALPLLLLSGLTGCGLPFSNYETVTVHTTSAGTDLIGAQCSLSNKNGTWLVTTPGSISVHLGSEQLAVKCVKDGYAPATYRANSSANFGAIMLEGAIASTVSGAAWDYPQQIIVPMTTLASSNTALR